MRIVAKIQLTSEGVQGHEAGAAIIERWKDRKFSSSHDGNLTIAQSGAEALVERVDEKVGDLSRTCFTILENIDGGTLQTDVHIVSSPNRTILQTNLSLSSDFGIAPIGISLRAPKFIRAAVQGDVAWTVGATGERVFAHSMVATKAHLDDFQTLVEFDKRCLPIVVVSEFDGQTLAGDLHDRLAQDLCGLAHVVRIEPEAAWELTRQWGAAWSCYNGAVRLLWPMRGSRGDPRAHPLWTRDWLMARADSEPLARERLRSAIGGRILDASTYVSDDPSLGDFARAADRAVADKARAALLTPQGPPTVEYERQIAALRKEIDAKDAEIRTLTDNLGSAWTALRTMRPADAGLNEEELPSGSAEPQSVVEAVLRAREELAGRVEIAHETDSDVARLNSEAGPPEKILRYLRTLGDLSNRLAQGPLGLSIPKWLEEQGVVCSGDSETAKNSAGGRKFRTRPVNGRDVTCDFHAKPTDGTSPDRCARIYFGTSPSAPHVLVGYIGRHEE